MTTAICPTPSRKRPQWSEALFESDALYSNKRQRSGFGRLRSLFPEMDDEIIRGVLDGCHQDMDSAIEKLTSLRLQPTVVETPDDWVEAFVGEMSRSRDVADAKVRATRALAAFERFIEQRSAEKVGRLEKENALLKRAVSIQAQRLNEARDLTAAQHNDIVRLNDKLKSAELHNYSLSVHLRHGMPAYASSSSSLPPGNNNDVF